MCHKFAVPVVPLRGWSLPGWTKTATIYPSLLYSQLLDSSFSNLQNSEVSQLNFLWLVDTTTTTSPPTHKSPRRGCNTLGGRGATRHSTHWNIHVYYICVYILPYRPACMQIYRYIFLINTYRYIIYMRRVYCTWILSMVTNLMATTCKQTTWRSPVPESYVDSPPLRGDKYHLECQQGNILVTFVYENS